MVIPNVWSLHRNERRFPEASRFNPERFYVGTPNFNHLTEGHYGFGFGRRSVRCLQLRLMYNPFHRYCPGKYLAAKSVWLGVVLHLWAFTIMPESDTVGNPILVNPDDCTSGITTCVQCCEGYLYTSDIFVQKAGDISSQDNTPIRTTYLSLRVKHPPSQVRTVGTKSQRRNTQLRR